MTDLVEFLRARLDEVAQLAQAVHGPEDAPWWSAEDIKTRLCDDQIWMHDAEHMARHSPARALDEVEAGRQAVAHYERVAARRDQHPEYELAVGAVEVQLKIRALPYADHPDYREEWKP